MERFTEQTLRRLAAIVEGPCVTMYMPARHTGANAATDMTRLKGLLREAETLLAGTPEIVTRGMLGPARELLNDFEFWKDPEHDMALFIAPGTFEIFRTPIPIAEQVCVGACFDLTQMLPLAAGDGEIHLLSLDQNRMRLFRGNRDELVEIPLPEPVRSLKEVAESGEEHAEMQLHSGTSPTHGERSKRNAIYHGTGSVPDRTKILLKELLTELDREVLRIGGVAETPLVLAGVDYLQAIYRGVSRHQHIVDVGIVGSTGRLGLAELRDAAWKLASPGFDAPRRSAIRALRDMEGTGLTSRLPEEILDLAGQGRVATLLVAMPSGADHATSDTDRAEMIRMVLAGAGKVYPVTPEELSPGEGVAAIMRY